MGELAEPLAMSLAAASKHVQVLERAGLLHRTVAAGATCPAPPRPARRGRGLAALVQAVLERPARPGGCGAAGSLRRDQRPVIIARPSGWCS